MELEDGEFDGDSSNFVILSEGCMSDILSRTSPRDACRASSVSWGFKSIADSDAVWERFLPPDYQDIISRSVSPVTYSSKKDLYFRLCDSPILLDGGKMSFSLNKRNGKKCFLLGAKELSIAWKDFWRWRSLPETRFEKVAELLAVCWLDIKGKFKTRMLSPETTYAAYLVFKFGATSHGLDFPAKTLVRLVRGREYVGEEEATTRTVYLKPAKSTCDHRFQVSVHRYAEDTDPAPQRRTDGWLEIELGKFYNVVADESEVDMRFMEIEELHWKSGLIVQDIDIRPKDDR